MSTHTVLRVALVPIENRVGDFGSNVARIRDAASTGAMIDEVVDATTEGRGNGPGEEGSVVGPEPPPRVLSAAAAPWRGRVW